jgi:hypothetical protein
MLSIELNVYFLLEIFRFFEEKIPGRARHDCLGCAPEARISIKKNISNSGYNKVSGRKCIGCCLWCTAQGQLQAIADFAVASGFLPADPSQILYKVC